MSDSDAEPVTAVAPDAKIEHALRNAVRDLWLSGDHENLTLRRVRKSVEHQLDLPDSFFRTDRAWKVRSENVITDQVSVQEREGGDAAPAEPEVPRAKAPRPAARPQKPQSSIKKAAPATKPTARKRQKNSSSSDDEALHSDASKSPQPPTKRNVKKPRVVQDDSEDEGGTALEPRPSSGDEGSPRSMSAHVGNGDSKGQDMSTSPARDAKPDSDSDMSVLLDEPPKKKQQKKGASTKASKPANNKSKSNDKDVDPQEAEIKRLQGWLIKCGIRKLWGKELKPFETPKAKISHLKDLLKDAGMEGRYSVEKARQIKERRELAADLEAVQEGAKRWGQSESEEEIGARPKRRLAKGLKDLEGLIESGDEESQ
ncbi:transcriptional regulator [Diplodia corticola]|uniref:Transcriptional regulator n=1 Tax=Diplodia corticola TaxID=236234 RepID=A0A1J9R6B8_9PEZI|nr:transcriptional regulator [Diplodia corticola]OJD37062.1 transcriptional regulator [Diplodia corticola]